MSRRIHRPQEPPPDVHDDEIEILEVVGVDEDAPPGSADADPDEVVLEFDEGPPSRGVAAPPVPSPKEESARTRLVRLQADFENLRKRVERERDDHYRHATGSLVARLLPVLDNFERAMAAPAAGSNDRSLREGLALVHRQLLDELTREGLRPIEAVGGAFDPLVHEAVEAVEATDVPENTVIEELQRGYWFHDRVIRPALVRVAVAPAGPGGPPDASEES